MEKSEIRKKYMLKRKALSADEVLSYSQNILENFVLQFKPTENQKVHIFLSIEKFNEINTQIFLNIFFKSKLQVFVPKIKNNKLISVAYTPTTALEKNSWGIWEPVANEDSGIRDYNFVITPLLYCDKKGNRVGYGKGYYDQFFKNLSDETAKIGVSFFPPEHEVSDISEDDVPLDYLVTPDAVLSFGNSASQFLK